MTLTQRVTVQCSLADRRSSCLLLWKVKFGNVSVNTFPHFPPLHTQGDLLKTHYCSLTCSICLQGSSTVPQDSSSFTAPAFKNLFSQHKIVWNMGISYIPQGQASVKIFHRCVKQ